MFSMQSKWPASSFPLLTLFSKYITFKACHTSEFSEVCLDVTRQMLLDLLAHLSCPGKHVILCYKLVRLTDCPQLKKYTCPLKAAIV